MKYHTRKMTDEGMAHHVALQLIKEKVSFVCEPVFPEKRKLSKYGEVEVEGWNFTVGIEYRQKLNVIIHRATSLGYPKPKTVKHVNRV